MDFLHAAIINFVVAGTFFFFIGMIASLPHGILGIVYLAAYLKERKKPAVRCQK